MNRFSIYKLNDCIQEVINDMI